jgi:hypothetical protein
MKGISVIIMSMQTENLIAPVFMSDDFDCERERRGRAAKKAEPLAACFKKVLRLSIVYFLVAEAPINRVAR